MMKVSHSARLAGHEKGMVFCTLVIFAFTMLMCTQQTVRGIAVWTENTELNRWISAHVSDVQNMKITNKEIAQNDQDLFEMRKARIRGALVNAAIQEMRYEA
nr:unnamed protein product [Haemonchus contortus]